MTLMSSTKVRKKGMAKYVPQLCAPLLQFGGCTMVSNMMPVQLSPVATRTSTSMDWRGRGGGAGAGRGRGQGECGGVCGGDTGGQVGPCGGPGASRL